MSTGVNDAQHSRMLFITQGPLPAVMRRLISASAVWYLLNYTFFVVDAYYIGRLGTAPLAAMSLICAVLALTLALAQGLGSALAAVTAVHWGARRHAEAARQVTHTIALALIVALLCWMVGMPTIDPLFRALGATADQLPFIHSYMPVWYAGFAFVMLSTVSQAAIRATGDVKTPLLILLGVGILNTLLDPLLMFGIGPLPALGMRGAAIAGVLSRALGAVVGLWIIARRDRLFSLTRGTARFGLRNGDWSQLTASWMAVARIAGPVVVQMLSLAVASMIMMRIAASLGSETLAGIGVGLRVDAIVSAMVLGLPIVLPTFIGQNVGAGKAPRAGQGILVGMRQVLITQTVLAALLFVSARTISSWFSSDPAVQDALALFLVVVPMGHIGYTLLTTSAGTLIALGHTRSQMLMALAPVVLSIAMAWTGARLFGTLGLIAAFPIARTVAGICAWSWVKGELRAAGFLAEAQVNAEPSAI